MRVGVVKMGHGLRPGHVNKLLRPIPSCSLVMMGCVAWVMLWSLTGQLSGRKLPGDLSATQRNAQSSFISLRLNLGGTSPPNMI